MKRIKQEQHIEIEEKSQQLKFRMQTEIQIDKHHALCQASDQLEELDYTKLYFAYSGIRKSQIEPRVLFKVLVCAYIYAKETRTEVREGRCGFRLWKSCHYRWLEENGQTAFIRINRITISAGASGLLLSFCSAAVSCIMLQKASFSKTFCHKLPDFTWHCPF